MPFNRFRDLVVTAYKMKCLVPLLTLLWVNCKVIRLTSIYLGRYRPHCIHQNDSFMGDSVQRSLTKMIKLPRNLFARCRSRHMLHARGPTIMFLALETLGTNLMWLLKQFIRCLKNPLKCKKKIFIFFHTLCIIYITVKTNTIITIIYLTSSSKLANSAWIGFVRQKSFSELLQGKTSLPVNANSVNLWCGAQLLLGTQQVNQRGDTKDMLRLKTDYSVKISIIMLSLRRDT